MCHVIFLVCINAIGKWFLFLSSRFIAWLYFVFLWLLWTQQCFFSNICAKPININIFFCAFESDLNWNQYSSVYVTHRKFDIFNDDKSLWFVRDSWSYFEFCTSWLIDRNQIESRSGRFCFNCISMNNNAIFHATIVLKLL